MRCVLDDGGAGGGSLLLVGFVGVVLYGGWCRMPQVAFLYKKTTSTTRCAAPGSVFCVWLGYSLLGVQTLFQLLWV